MLETALIKQWQGLQSTYNLQSWTLKIDRAYLRGGMCRYAKKEIGISRNYLNVAKDSEVINTLLHEIAHALTPGHRHDSIWRAKALEIGCNGNRCHSVIEVRNAATVIYQCKCQVLKVKRFRKLRKGYSYRQLCSTCNTSPQLNGFYQEKVARPLFACPLCNKPSEANKFCPSCEKVLDISSLL